MLGAGTGNPWKHVAWTDAVVVSNHRHAHPAIESTQLMVSQFSFPKQGHSCQYQSEIFICLFFHFRDFWPFIFPSPLSSLQVYTLCSCFSPGQERDFMAGRNADPLVFCCKHPSNPASESPGVLIFLLTAKTNDPLRDVCSCLPKVSMTFLEDDLFFKHKWSFLSAVTYKCEGRVRLVLRKP